MTTLSKCIVHHGTEAVREYHEMSGGMAENEMPEIFLGGCIARGIHHDLGYNTTVERLYTKIASELGVAPNQEMTESRHRQRADVAVYRDRRPIAIIEVKKFEHPQSMPKLSQDLAKMRRATSTTGLPFFLAALISENEKSEPAAQIRMIEQALCGAFDALGPLTPSGDGKWNWQFACGSFALKI